MKTKIQNPLFYGILIILFLITAIAISRSYVSTLIEPELYKGQSTVLALDSAYTHALDTIGPSSFAIQMESVADLKLFDNPKKEGKPKFHVRQSLGGSIGAGTVVGEKVGYLLTAKHVVNEAGFIKKADEIKAKIKKENPGLYLETEVITQYTLTDDKEKQFMAIVVVLGDEELGLIHVTNTKNFTAKSVPISTETKLAGKSAAIFGAPQGIKDYMTEGRISKKERVKTEDGEFMYVDASINPGNSGGALITLGDMKLAGVISQVEINDDPPSLTDIGLFVPNDIINKFLKKAMPK